MNDYSKDEDFSDINSTSILKDTYDQSSEQKFLNEILKINNLIKVKYSLDKKGKKENNNQVVKNFLDIKRSAGQLYNNIKQIYPESARSRFGYYVFIIHTILDIIISTNI